MSGFKRLLNQKRNPPLPTTESFAGKTVLITGTTSGLGLEAAKKLAALNASRLIITARTIKKGEITKLEIERHVRQHITATGAKTTTSTEIVVMPLDMSSVQGVQSFKSKLDTLLGARGGLDATILNAGVSQRSYIRSPDRYEETMQVNVLSTALLALLVLPYLLSSSKFKSQPSHLSFVSSGLANTVTTQSMDQYLTSKTPFKDISLPNNFPPGKFGGQKQYARSKLLVEYMMRHIASSPSLVDPSTKTPLVIVNSTCPGLCKSDLGRQFSGSIFMKIALWIFYALFARTAEQGANSYISAVLRDEESQGRMWKDDQVYEPGEMLTSKEGIEYGETVWRELREILVQCAPEVKELV